MNAQRRDSAGSAGVLAAAAGLLRALVGRREVVEQPGTAVHAVELRFESLVQGITDYAIFMLDRQGRITSWNVGAARIKGYTADEVLGRSFEMFFTDEDRRAGLPAHVLAETMRTGRHESEGWRVRHDGSRFWANAVVDAIVGDDGELVAFAKITRDITERREMEHRLAQAQKMEAFGQLSGGIAHDFNNLLQVVSGNLELARAALVQGSTARAERLLDNALRGIDRGGRLTAQLLAFSRRQVLHAERSLAGELVADMTDLLRSAAGDRVAVQTRSEPELWSCRVDPGQFEAALLNLVLNARDAMPRGGVVSIATSNERLGSAEARALDVAPGDYVRVEVVDTGAGMSPETLSRAAEPFFTTKELGKGSGLGLPQVIGFTRQSGGAVSLRSNAGEGTTVALLFPRDPEPEPGEAGQTPAPAENSLDVLLAVDDPLAADALQAALTAVGHRPRIAAGAAAALVAAQSDHPVDLLLCDLAASAGIDAMQVIRAARRQRPALRVMLACGDLAEALEGNSLRPPVDILGKPVSAVEVLQRIAVLVPSYGVV